MKPIQNKTQKKAVASHRTPKGVFALAAMFLLPILIGCGPSRPATAPVKGKITYQGNPVPEGTIVFYPEKGRSASGRIQSDGTYVLTTFAEADGALLGSHEVTIEAIHFTRSPQPKSLEEELSMSKNQSPTIAPPQRLLPQTYASRTTSGLTAEVTSGENVIDFELPKK